MIRPSKTLKKYGKVLGKAGIAARTIHICKEVAETRNYVGAIKALGKLHALAIACGYDDYWEEKERIGFHHESNIAERVVMGKTELVQQFIDAPTDD